MINIVFWNKARLETILSTMIGFGDFFQFTIVYFIPFLKR